MVAVLLLAFLVVPLAEIYVIVLIGHAIGGWQTVLLLLVWSAFGAWLVKREGRRAWTAFRTAAASGRLPGREAADGALLLVGGALLLTPGFLTDAVGLLLVLPVTRPLARRAVLGYAARRTIRSAGPRRIRVRVHRGPDARGRPPAGQSPIIEGRVVRRSEDEPDLRG